MKVTVLETFKANRKTFQKGLTLSQAEINLIIDILQKLIVGGLVKVDGEPLPLPDQKPEECCDDDLGGEDLKASKPEKASKKKGK